MQKIYACAAVSACLFLSACASAPSSAELDKLTAAIIKASFRDEGLVKVDRLVQDDANRECSAADVAGKPISRLYAAGELGSSFGHLYLSGGNIAECFVTGWVAGREAAREKPWS